MADSQTICGTELLSRYFDGELDGDDLKKVKSHIDSCDSCRNRSSEYAGITAGFDSLLSADFIGDDRVIEEKVIASIRKKSSRSAGWKNFIFTKRSLVPAGLAASVMIIFMAFFNTPAPTGPTAIVSSLISNGSRVSILETPETRQTIIWISENG